MCESNGTDNSPETSSESPGETQRAVQFDTRQEQAKNLLLKELYVGEEFTEDRTMRKEELQRHCEAVWDDVEETVEMHAVRIEDNKRKETIAEEGIISETSRQRSTIP